VALLGDTAWAGPTGMGTSLALVGAHVLAGELSRTPSDPRGALHAYEKFLRPHVEKTQQLPPGVPGIALPKSSWGLKVLHGVHRLAATRALRAVAERAVLTSASSGFELPEYPHLRPGRDQRRERVSRA
jgi:2-polyprenyl-6-methoxyphenol hydroxylase-like FAD-dependent oxidoreductase